MTKSIGVLAVALILGATLAEGGQAARAAAATGPFPVGFRIMEATDASRAYPSQGPAAAPAARPVRVYVWYPAARGARQTMRVADYVREAAADFHLLPDGARVTDEALPLPVPLAKGLTEPERAALLARPTAASRDAAPLDRRSPLVVLGQGLYYESPLSQYVLAEHLAALGYAVATCPLVGTRSRLVQLSIVDLETEVSDLEFVIGRATSLRFVDPERIGVVGYDLGGMAALLLTMQDPRVRAMATLDAGILFKHPSGLPGISPHYQEARFQVPWLMLTRPEHLPRDIGFRGSLFERKTVGDSYLVLMKTWNHGGFSSYATFGITRGVPGYWREVAGQPREAHEVVCRYVASFLDAYLKHDGAAQRFLQQDPATAGLSALVSSVTFKKGEEAPLLQDEIIHDIIRLGTTNTLPRLRAAWARPDGRPVIDQASFNWLGYHFLNWWGREREAIDVFQFITEAFPTSSNAFDSLGEALAVNGRNDEAIAAYRTALRLEPGNANAAAALKRLGAKGPE